MRAAILSIGHELTLGQALDTNSRWLAEQLGARSVVVDEHRTVADDRAAIAQAVRDLSRGRNLLVITGGLGPTDDDLTRAALGDVMTPGEALVEDAQALGWVNEWFAGRGRSMPRANLVQALRPRTMRCIPNAHGTAPGLSGSLGGCAIYALPGPPPEMMPMFVEHVAPELAAAPGGEVLLTGRVNLFGLGESLAAEKLGDMLARDRAPARPLVGITASGAIISARVSAFGPAKKVRAMIDADLDAIERAWRPWAFGRDEETLAQALGGLLRREGRTIATAESCTGGWLGKRVVDVAGSSAYYLGGWITYANDMKVDSVGVDAGLLAAHGAVSPEVAQAMAEGARARAGADYALSITGIAGPDAAPAKPVGLVFIALAQPDRATTVRRFEFTGDRSAIRDRSTLAAMQMLRFALLGVGAEVPLIWEVSPRKNEPLGRV